MTFRHAMALADLWDGEMQSCTLGARRILVLKLDGVVHAYEDRCAHQGVPLSEGEFEDGILTCRAHHWQYDMRSGHGVNPASACLKSMPVRVENGSILVDAD
jgi:toluene monooxygenase system ferredoxin subunit